MRNKTLLLLLIAGLVLLFAVLVLRQTKVSANAGREKQPVQAIAKLGDEIIIHASGRGAPYINLRDGRELPSVYTGAENLQLVLQQNRAESLTLAAADFDNDGVPDLISGYASGGKGLFSLHRGNARVMLSQQTAQADSNNPETVDSPFQLLAKVFSLPEPPDFLRAGDFNADLQQDLVIAARGSNTLYFIPGDGSGGFSEAKPLPLPGMITAMTSGTTDGASGRSRVAVGIVGADSAKVLIFDGESGALQSNFRSFALPAEATSLAIGHLSDASFDVAIAAGSELLTLSVLQTQSESVAQVIDWQTRINQRILPFAIKAMTLGNFTDCPLDDVAILGNDGALYVLSNKKADGKQAAASRGIGKWELTALGSGYAGQVTQMLSAKLSDASVEDLIIVEPDNRQLHIIGVNREQQATLDIEGEPVAGLPMLANSLKALFILRKGHSTPSIVLAAAAECSELSTGEACVNIQEVPDGDGGINFVLGSPGVVETADFRIEKSALINQDSLCTNPPSGSEPCFQYTIRVTNKRPHMNVTVTDILGDHVIFLGFVSIPPGWSPSVSGNTILFNKSNWDAIETVTFRINGDFDLSMPTYRNCAKVSGCRADQADLSIIKSVSTRTANVGDLLTYTLTVKNNGPEMARLVRVADVLPPEVMLMLPGTLPEACLQLSTGTHDCEIIGNSVSIVYPNLKVGQLETITLMAKVNCALPNDTQIKNIARVTSGFITDTNPNNNFSDVAMATTTISNPPPGLTCASVPPVCAAPGQTHVAVTVPRPTVSDCEEDIVPVFTRSDGQRSLEAPFEAGKTTTVIWRATDSFGNVMTCSTNVVVTKSSVIATQPDFGVVVIGKKGTKNKSLKATFKISSPCDKPFDVRFASLIRDGLGVDTQAFSIFDGTTQLAIGANSPLIRIPQGGKEFRVELRLIVPAPKSGNLTTADILPVDMSKTHLKVEVSGEPPTDIAFKGSIADALQIISPFCASRPEDKFFVSFSMFNPGLTASSVTYEFLNADQSVAATVTDNSLTSKIQNRSLVKGQTYGVDFEVSGARGFPNVASVRVTITNGLLTSTKEINILSSSPCAPGVSAAQSLKLSGLKLTAIKN